MKFLDWLTKKKEVIYIKTPEDNIADLLGRGIDWYDYKTMDLAGRMAYWNNAQAILKNDVFINELNHWIADCVKNTAYETKNFEQVMNIRTGIVFLETLKERIESIENPSKIENTEDLNSAI